MISLDSYIMKYARDYCAGRVYRMNDIYLGREEIDLNFVNRGLIASLLTFLQ